jgi:hypothetical protein
MITLWVNITGGVQCNCSAIQEISRLLWYREVHYHSTSTAIDGILRQKNAVHFTPIYSSSYCPQFYVYISQAMSSLQALQ